MTVQHRLPLVHVLQGSKKVQSTSKEVGSLYVSVVFRPVASVSHTVNSLVTDYVCRTRRNSLAKCLDLTTGLLNPASQSRAGNGCYGGTTAAAGGIARSRSMGFSGGGGGGAWPGAMVMRRRGSRQLGYSDTEGFSDESF